MYTLGAADLSPVRTEQIIVSDGKGEFGISKNGTIVVLSGYPNVGAMFAPGTAQHTQVLGNLAAVGSNRQRIESFLGQKAPVGTTVVASPAPQGAQGVPGVDAGAGSSLPVPYTQRWWFWPAVGTAGVVVTGLVLWQVAGLVGIGGMAASRVMAKRAV